MQVVILGEQLRDMPWVNADEAAPMRDPSSLG
jgi:hypothetical protein